MHKYIIGAVVGALLASAVIVLAGTAGTLEPDNPPNLTESYTLEDIYDRLDAGADGAPGLWAEPLAGPAPTGHTLSETMALAPQINASGAVSTEVTDGKTFWGLTGGEWGLQTGTATGGGAYPALVARTGQTPTLPIDPAPTGSDGNLEMGVEWPNPRFITGTTGVVTDTLTGLIWLEYANCPDTTRLWSEALSDVTQLNTNGQMNNNNCGDISNGGTHQTDWRLPNMRELYSLVHYGVHDPAVPNTEGTGKWAEGDPFTDVWSDDYWSSSTYASDTGYAWSVNLTDGSVTNYNKTNIATYVWPVRGGQ